MAELGFTEAEEMLRKQVIDFAQKEIKPVAKELAVTEGLPRWLRSRLGEMGYLGVSIPEEWGGMGMGAVSQGIVMEELAKVSIAASRPISLPHMLHLLLDEAEKEKLNKYFPAMAEGKLQQSWAITEPEAGTNASAMQMRADRDGDYYVLNGEKTAITWAMQEDLDQFVVFAKTDPSAGARGVSCFIVPADTQGISKSKIPLMGFSVPTSGSVSFDNVRIPVGSRVGEEGKGFYYIMRRFDINKVILSLEALGLASASLDDAINYSKERISFGKPLAKYEDIAFKIAENVALVTMARHFCYHTLRKQEQGLPLEKEAAMCKWFGPYIATQIVHDCLLMHGHVGYSEEHPIADRMKQVIGYEIADGTAQAQKLALTRHIFGKEFLPY